MSRTDVFRSMLEKDPNNALARFGLANELMKAEAFAEARAELTTYLAGHTDEGAGYRLLARACEGLGLAEEAREAYRRGAETARRHGHPSMAGEFEEKMKDEG